MKLTTETPGVDIVVTALPEMIPVRGNVCATGDDALDRELEDEIISKIDAGDEWAWCMVCVSVVWKSFLARSTLGCCSYRDTANANRNKTRKDFPHDL